MIGLDQIRRAFDFYRYETKPARPMPAGWRRRAIEALRAAGWRVASNRHVPDGSLHLAVELLEADRRAGKPVIENLQSNGVSPPTPPTPPVTPPSRLAIAKNPKKET